MTPEQEQEVFIILGRLEGKMDAFTSILNTHTAQDSENFEKLEVSVDALRLDQAHKNGIAEEAARTASSSGGKWGAAMGTGASLIIAAISAYFSSK